jgi:hypothetical protein
MSSHLRMNTPATISCPGKSWSSLRNGVFLRQGFCKPMRLKSFEDDNMTTTNSKVSMVMNF